MWTQKAKWKSFLSYLLPSLLVLSLCRITLSPKSTGYYIYNSPWILQGKRHTSSNTWTKTSPASSLLWLLRHDSWNPNEHLLTGKEASIERNAVYLRGKWNHGLNQSFKPICPSNKCLCTLYVKQPKQDCQDTNKVDPTIFLVVFPPA